ncbi:MAG: NADP-dependent isocitrate dehydrogenase [Clostridiales bacterium]|jgi:isocitrate dehydrogenase|nr:NADP-dependent isocitrate dehydrogenase [Clostridiales bacterium]
MSRKIKMTTPLVEIQGDEMTRILWDWIKEILLEPYIDLNLETYDLALKARDDTADAVTVAAGRAILKHRVGVKCATITSTPARVKEYALKGLLPSPNATIRGILDGTVFRTPVLVKGILPSVPAWTAPITIARHAYGDVYNCVEATVAQGQSAYITVKDAAGNVVEEKLCKTFTRSGGVLRGMHNVTASIESFARACFTYALSAKTDLLFGAKDTISKTYDGHFQRVFEDIFTKEYTTAFADAGITYRYALVDDAVAQVMKSNGGLIWACKNYDGDVFSDMVATCYGSLAMMTSVLVSPEGNFEYEAAHGTVTRHYYKYLKGESTSTNPIATLFAWTGALAKRGELDGNAALSAFAKKLEAAALAAIEGGEMTGDLIPLFRLSGVTPKKLDSRAFLQAIAARL